MRGAPARCWRDRPRTGWIDDDLLRAALADALAELRETLGEDPAGVALGRPAPPAPGHPLAAIPGLEALFVAADVEMGGDEQTVMQGGFDGRDGYRAAVIPSWRASTTSRTSTAASACSPPA